MKKNFRKQNSNVKCSLRLETLESREMLSAVPLSAAEYADLRVQYAEFNLSENMADMNVITLDLAEGDGLSELKAAITEAGTTAKSDLIVVRTSDEANTIKYTAQADELTVNINATNYGSVTIVGLGTENLTLNATLKCRVMTITDSTTIANLGGLTFINGKAANSLSSNNYGGGIYNTNATLAASSCTFSENIASYGGGIFNSSGTITVINSTFSENSASYGGGIYSDSGKFTITNSTLSGNVAANNGGGIKNGYSTTLTVTDCMFSENSASNGGGIGNDGVVTVLNCTLSGNSASSGGGILNSNVGSSTITNCLLSGNSASGGGICNAGLGTITNSTLSGNTSSSWPYCGIYNTGTITINNTIIVGNTTNDFYNSGTIKGSNNLSTYTDWTSGSNNLVYDTSKPLFVDAANGDYHLIEGAQAIDKGDNSKAIDPYGEDLTVDLGNNARIYNGTVDIGVYEYHSAPTYNETDCAQILAFLEQTDSSDVKNGSKINVKYSSTDVTTWTGVTWTEINGELRATKIDWLRKNLSGNCDFSALTELTYLDVAGSVNGNTVYGKITTINVSTCTKLEYFDCSRNQLTSLDVSNNTKITTLWCNENPLGSLDITHNVQLKKLSCSKNNLTTLTISQCSDLDYLLCSGNQLTYLDISSNRNLQTLDCSQNKLTSLDVSNYGLLEKLYCNDNQLTSLNVTGCSKLKTIWTQSNKLTSLNVSDCAALVVLACYSNSLTSMDVSRNSNLKFYNCSWNKITSINVASNLKLEYINVSGNVLTNLDLSLNTNLWGLNCRKCGLTTLDVSKNTKLKHLDCSSNQLTELDVSQNVELSGPDGTTSVSFDGSGVKFGQSLYGLKCYDNPLTTLDVSKNTKLTYLECLDASNLQTVIVSPESAGKLMIMRSGYDSTTWNVYDASGEQQAVINSSNQTYVLPELPMTVTKADGTQTVSFVNVEEVTYHTGDTSALRAYLEQTDSSGKKNGIKINSGYDANDPATWTGVTWTVVDGEKRVTQINWRGMGLVGVLNLEGCGQLTDLNVESNQLAGVNVRNCAELVALRVSYNTGISVLDVSTNLKITTLACGTCSLSELNVRNNTLLEKLWCPLNQLTELDLSRNVNLNTLWCQRNQFTELNLTSNTQLTTLYCLDPVDYPLSFVFLNTSITSLQIGSYWGGMWTFKDYQGEQLATGARYTTSSFPLMAVSPSGNETIQFCYKIKDSENVYNDEVYSIQAFLEQASNGVKNGTRLNANYSPDDPTTWTGLTWTKINGELRVTNISWQGKALAGSLNLSACTQLEYINVESNRLSNLSLPGNGVLNTLLCWSNALAALDVSACLGLKKIHCGLNAISTLDVTRNTQLTELHCNNMQLTELDISQNPALTNLFCYNTSLSSVWINSQCLGKLSVYMVSSNSPTETWTWKDSEENVLGSGTNFRLSTIPVFATSPSLQEVQFTLADTEVLRNFLEIKDENGVKNGTKLNVNYSSDDPATWTGVTFEMIANTQRVTEIDWNGKHLLGALNVSGFTCLTNLDLRGNAISSLTFTKNTSLANLQYTTYRNRFLTLNVSGRNVITNPVSGFVSVENRKIVYKPNTYFTGTDSFVLGFDSSEKAVSVTVEVPNLAPVAKDDSFTNNGQNFIILDVLANDSDPDGDMLSIVSVPQPTHGQAAAFADGKIFYMPVGNVTNDSFTYTISDGHGGTSTATVTITAPENAAPVAVDDSARVELNGHVVIDVLANDSDPDGDALSILSVNQPVNGSVVLTKDDKILYLPKTGFSGTDSFMYTVSDGHGGTAEAVVNVEVIRTFKPLIVAESGASPEKISEWEVFNVALLNGEGLAETQTVSLAWDASLFELNVAEAASESGVSVELGAAVTENGITTQNVVLSVENPAALAENDLLASLEFVPIAADSLKAGDSSDWTISVNREALNVAVESFAYDLNDSGSVEINDLVAFARVFNQSSAESETARIVDFDGSGTVEINDLVLFARNFGKSRPTKPTAAAQTIVPSATKLEDLPTARGNVTDAAMAAYWDETK